LVPEWTREKESKKVSVDGQEGQCSCAKDLRKFGTSAFFCHGTHSIYSLVQLSFGKIGSLYSSCFLVTIIVCIKKSWVWDCMIFLYKCYCIFLVMVVSNYTCLPTVNLCSKLMIMNALVF
jgi:hypothetical protein